MAAAVDIVGMMARLEPWFPGASWDPWRAVLKAAFALPMPAAEVEFFHSVADRDPPRRRARELWCATGQGRVHVYAPTTRATWFLAGLAAGIFFQGSLAGGVMSSTHQTP
jgi:hypothetical protein